MLIKKIVIASVLKPVNDARMYEKIGRSLAEDGKYEVHIIGYPATIPTNTNIHFHPLKKFSRLSFRRFASYWNITKNIYKVKPEILIVNTHELLIISVIFKILFGFKLLYDIQENYFRNIWYQSNYPPLVKHLMAVAIRTIEWFCMPFIDHKILAEHKYRNELPFTGKNSTEVLNKYNPLAEIRVNRKSELTNKIRFIYSGTIAKVYGIEDAISFFKTINKYIDSTLLIIGHCPNDEVFKYLKSEASAHANMALNISPTPIDHSEIIQEYDNVDIALAPYKPNKSTENCVPVKFYEYIAHKLPIIIPDHNSYWIDFLSQYQGFIATNYTTFKAEAIIAKIISNSFYTNPTPDSIFWESEKDKLLHILANI